MPRDEQGVGQPIFEMEPKMIRFFCIALVCAAFAGLPAGAQVEKPASVLETASMLTSLDAIDQPAWHLKLDVTMFDDKGKNPSVGTVEVWHRNADERRVYTFGDATSTTLRHDGKTFYDAGGSVPSFQAEEVLRQVLHPGPMGAEMNGAVPEARKQKFGKVELTCVMLTQPIKGAGEIPLGLFPTYCLDANGLIRFTYNFGGHEVFLNEMGTFLGQRASTDIVIREHHVEVASAKVTSLVTYTPQADEFTPATGMVEVGPDARIPAGVISGHRISFVEPVYPEGAKIRHASGTVLLHAIIGRDGHVRSLRPMNAADADFVISAIAAVRQWVYSPYLLNGEPTEVDTTITVNFALSEN
jgi:Gram-negative bacterial TonB protein C-terminal